TRWSRRVNRLSSPLVVVMEGLPLVEEFVVEDESTLALGEAEVADDSVFSLIAGAPATSAAVEVTKERTVSEAISTSRFPVAAAAPVPAAPPATVPTAAPLPPPAIAPMIAPKAAPPPILVALLFPCESPFITRGVTRKDEVRPPELTVLRTRSSSP